MGIEVLPPDVNTSQGGFSIVKEDGVEKIRFGLYTIKNLGEEISDAIIAEREKNGKYKGLEDFIERVQHRLLNKKSLEALALSGATDSLCKRSLILENMEALLEHHKAIVKEKETGQDSLFGSINMIPPLKLKEGKEPTLLEKLAHEKELLGLYISGSPLDPWKEKIEERKCDIGRVQHEFGDGKSITIGVIVENVKVTKTKKGDLMALLKISDYTGSLEVAVFPESYKKYKALCVPDITLLVKGKVSSRNGEKTMMVDELTKLG
jgi:DNA polymerase-3 subunit alpha